MPQHRPGGYVTESGGYGRVALTVNHTVIKRFAIHDQIVDASLQIGTVAPRMLHVRVPQTGNALIVCRFKSHAHRRHPVSVRISLRHGLGSGYQPGGMLGR